MDSSRLQSWEPLFDRAMSAIDSLPPHLPKLEWTIGGGTVAKVSGADQIKRPADDKPHAHGKASDYHPLRVPSPLTDGSARPKIVYPEDDRPPRCPALPCPPKNN